MQMTRALQLPRTLAAGVLGLAFFGGMTGPGCSASTEAVLAALGSGCVLNSDCEAELICAFRVCHEACLVSSDCALGLRCVTTDGGNVCLLEEESRCLLNSDCPEPLVCGADGECRNQCLADPDCLADQVCSSSRVCALPEELVGGELEQPAQEGQLCTFSSDCELPARCLGGYCRLECQDNSDCPTPAGSPERRCLEGLCELAGQGSGADCVPNEQRTCSCDNGDSGVQFCAGAGFAGDLDPVDPAFSACAPCSGTVVSPSCWDVDSGPDPAVRSVKPFTLLNNGFNTIIDVAVHPDGIVIIGTYDNLALGGGTTLQTTDVDALAVFVALLDNDTLDPIWAAGVEAPGHYMNADAVAVDGSGNIWVGGHYREFAILPPQPDFGGGPLVAAGFGSATFLWKLDANGQHLFSRGFAHQYSGQQVFDLAVAPSDRIVVAGSQAGTVDFGGGALPYTNIQLQTYLASFEPDGTHFFSFPIVDLDGEGQYTAVDLAIKSDGSIGLLTKVTGSVDVGGGPVNGLSTPLLLAHFSSGGSFISQRAFGGPMLEAIDVSTHPAGGFSLLGAGPDGTDLGGGPLGSGSLFEASFDPGLTHLSTFAVPQLYNNYGAIASAEDGSRIVATKLTNGATIAGCTLGGFDFTLYGVPAFYRTNPAGQIDWVRAYEGSLWEPIELSARGGRVAALLEGEFFQGTEFDVGNGPILGDMILVVFEP